MRNFTEIQEQFIEAAGQYIAEGKEYGSGMLISPKLFLTAGHVALPEPGEYTLFDDNTEEFVRYENLADHERSNAEIAQLCQTITYDPTNIPMEHITSSSVSEENSSMEIKFDTKAGEIRRKGKVLCGVCNELIDFALIELDEPIISIETPSLSVAPQHSLEKAIIFHYPGGAERKASIANITRQLNDVYQLKTIYTAETADKSSGAALINNRGHIFSIHSYRDLVFEEVIEELNKIPDNQKKSLEEIEAIFRNTDGKKLAATPISEIFSLHSNATNKFKDSLSRHHVTVFNGMEQNSQITFG